MNLMTCSLVHTIRTMRLKVLTCFPTKAAVVCINYLRLLQGKPSDGAVYGTIFLSNRLSKNTPPCSGILKLKTSFTHFLNALTTTPEEGDGEQKRSPTQERRSHGLHLNVKIKMRGHLGN